VAGRHGHVPPLDGERAPDSTRSTRYAGWHDDWKAALRRRDATPAHRKEEDHRMSNFTRALITFFGTFVFASAIVACGGVEGDDQYTIDTETEESGLYYVEVMESVYSPTSGGGCKVTSGTNAGKTGTYSKDKYGNWWCEGSWGGSQCGGTPNKCENL
jgi:hypothetical protein